MFDPQELQAALEKVRAIEYKSPLYGDFVRQCYIPFMERIATELSMTPHDPAERMKFTLNYVDCVASLTGMMFASSIGSMAHSMHPLAQLIVIGDAMAKLETAINNGLASQSEGKGLRVYAKEPDGGLQ